MPEPATAVVRCAPHCPKCGWLLPAPEELEHKPGVAWIAVVCAGCDWRGHAKYWARQTDEPA